MRGVALGCGGLLGAAAYTYSQFREYEALQLDGEMEERLPLTAEAQRTRVVRLPKFLSEEELAEVQRVHDEHGVRLLSGSVEATSVGPNLFDGGLQHDASGSTLTLSPSASTWGIARCTPGALIPATVTAQGFIAVATAAVDIVEGSRAKLYSRDSLVVMVFAAPAVDAISPDIGSAAGGSIVALSGRNLRRGEPGAFTDTYATFGGVAVPLRGPGVAR